MARPNTKKSKKQAWLIIGGIIFAFVFITSIFGNEKTESRPATTPPAVNETKTPRQVITNKEESFPVDYLFDSPEDFRRKFNDAAGNNELEVRLGSPAVSKGAVNNTFTARIADNISIIGTLNKENDKVKELMLISGGGDVKHVATLIETLANIIATVDPSLQPEERGSILKKLGLFNENSKHLMGLDEKTVKNGIKYVISISEYTGIMFSISKVN